jgi:transcriptional antiterminator RfaH
LPRFLKRRRHARRLEIVPAPLFPRYLFVQIDMASQRWRLINSTRGVCGLVCNGDRPATLPDLILNELHSREDHRGFIVPDARPRFRPGDKVRILDGVFAACLGLYESMTDQERVAVLLDLLGRKVRIVVDSESVAAA